MAPQRLTIAFPLRTELPTIDELEARDPEKAHAFRADLRAASETSRNATSAKRAISHDNTWDIWLDYCNEHNTDSLLAAVPDPIPFFIVFAQRYRDGRLAKDGEPVRSRTVEEALRAVGQTMASMGAKDQRLDKHGDQEYRIKSLGAQCDAGVRPLAPDCKNHRHLFRFVQNSRSW